MPGALRLKLDRAIERHLSEHRSRHYDLLRRDPNFAPWIGAALGSRGEKRLDRYIREVKERLARRGRRRVATQQLHEVQPNGARGSAYDAEDVGAPLAGAGPAFSYEELQASNRRILTALERAMEDCRDDEGAIVHYDRYTKLSREHRARQITTAELLKRYSADSRDPSLLNRVVALLLEAHSGDPEQARALIQTISELVRETGGIAAIGRRP